MKNKKKNRISYSLSAELKNALKYLLIWGMILIFSAYLLSDSEILFFFLFFIIPLLLTVIFTFRTIITSARQKKKLRFMAASHFL